MLDTRAHRIIDTQTHTDVQQRYTHTQRQTHTQTSLQTRMPLFPQVSHPQDAARALSRTQVPLLREWGWGLSLSQVFLHFATQTWSKTIFHVRFKALFKENVFYSLMFGYLRARLRDYCQAKNWGIYIGLLNPSFVFDYPDAHLFARIVIPGVLFLNTLGLDRTDKLS
jgi:hypothetical protein